MGNNESNQNTSRERSDRIVEGCRSKFGSQTEFAETSNASMYEWTDWPKNRPRRDPIRNDPIFPDDRPLPYDDFPGPKRRHKPKITTPYICDQ